MTFHTNANDNTYTIDHQTDLSNGQDIIEDDTIADPEGVVERRGGNSKGGFRERGQMPPWVQNEFGWEKSGDGKWRVTPHESAIRQTAATAEGILDAFSPTVLEEHMDAVHAIKTSLSDSYYTMHGVSQWMANSLLFAMQREVASTCARAARWAIRGNDANEQGSTDFAATCAGIMEQSAKDAVILHSALFLAELGDKPLKYDYRRAAEQQMFIEAAKHGRELKNPDQLVNEKEQEKATSASLFSRIVKKVA